MVRDQGQYARDRTVELLLCETSISLDDSRGIMHETGRWNSLCVSVQYHRMIPGALCMRLNGGTPYAPVFNIVG